MQSVEITGAIIDSNYVTNDLQGIKAALLAGHHVRYVNRQEAESVARRRDCPGWWKLAEGPTLYVLVEGDLYRAKSTPASLSIPMTASVNAQLSAAAG